MITRFLRWSMYETSRPWSFLPIFRTFFVRIRVFIIASTVAIIAEIHLVLRNIIYNWDNKYNEYNVIQINKICNTVNDISTHFVFLTFVDIVWVVAF